MASKELSIKVKVNLPTAGEIENQIQRSLRGLKDIKVDANVKLKVGKLGNLKRQLRNALGKENFRVNANVKVHGMSELNRVSSKLKEIRRLANEPIKLNVDMGGHGFDKSIEEARRKANKELENISPHSSSAMLTAQKEMRAQQRAIEKAQKEYLRAQNQAVKASDERIKQNMQHYASQVAKQQEEAERQYATAARRAGLSDSEISKNVLGFREQPKARMAVRNSEIQQQIKQEEAALRNYKRAVDEATRAQVSMVKGRGNIGDNQIRELGNEYERAAQKVQKYARALRSTSRAEEAADYRAAAESKVRMAEAKRADGEYRRVRRAKSSGTGIMNTLNTWDVLQTGAMAVAGVISGVNEVDKAITKVTKVVPDSQRAVNQWKKNIYRDAAEVGKTAPEFASAVEQWATAGYNLKQSNRLAKTSVMGSFVGEVPVNDMVRYMSVPMKAFQKEGLKSVDIVNAMNQVSNKHAIEMDDLGQAYQKASATMGATGTTFAQMTGIITAAQEGTRAGGDQIGTAFKTISANLAQVGSGITKQAQNKRDFFDSLGVQLKDSNGNLKSTYQIMDQLSKKWKTMSKQDKNTASLYAAGKNHANIFSATMDNWDTAKDAMREAEDQKGLGTSGSAYQEMEKQKQSIEFQLKGLQDTWMSFLQNLSGGREGIGQMLSIAAGFGKVMDGLASNKLLSSTARWGILSAGLIMARKGFAAVAGSFGEMISQGKKGDSFIERLTGIKKKTDAIKDSSKELKNAWNDLLGKKTSKGLSQTEKNIKDLGGASSNKSSDKPNAIAELRNSTSGHEEQISNETRARKKNTESIKNNSEARKSSGKTMVEETTGLANYSRAMDTANAKATTHGKVMSKVGKAWGVAKAGLGVLGASLGYVGIALDTITIAGAAMEAMGIHPIKMLKAAMDPVGESAKQLDKYIGKVGKSVEKTSSAIESNGLVTGQLTADLKSVGDMKGALGSLQVKDGKYAGDNFEQLKKNFNEIAKHNGLELRIRGGESVDAVNNKVEALNKNMDVAKKESALDLGKNVSKNVDNVNKLLSDKNLDKLRDSNREYNKQLDALKAQYQRRGSHGEFLGYNDGFQQRKRKLDESISWGKNNGAIWHSKQGKKILSNVHKAQRSVRDAIDGMASALNDGTLSVDNLKSMNDRGRQAGALALVKNLQGLRGSSDQGKKDDITKQLSSVLTNASQKQIQAIAKYADKENSNGKLLGALSKAGIQTEMLASMAGIGAQAQQQYSSRYGKNWIQRAAKDQSDFDSFSSKKGNKGATNLESLVNQNTGFIDYDRIARFNGGRATYGEGRRRLKSTGLKYNSKDPLSAVDIGKATMGLDGDAITTLNDITDGKATSRQIMTVANNNRKKYDKNNNVVKGSGATAKQLVQAVAEASKGRDNLKQRKFDSTIDDMVADGLITKEQGEKATKQRSKNYTKDGYAKNYKAAMDQIGDKQLTENAFKNYAKNLDKSARKQLADQLKKNDQISKNAYNDLTKDFAKGTNQKNSKKTPKTAREAEKQLGTKKISQSDLKALQKNLKSNKERKQLQYDLNRKNQVKTPWGQRLKDFFNPVMTAHASTKGRKGSEAGSDWFSKQIKGIQKGFTKNGLFGGIGNLNKMKNQGLQNLFKGASSGLDKFLFGKNGFKNTSLGKMFSGKNNPFKGLQKDFGKMFSGKNNPINSLKKSMGNLFSGKNNPFKGIKNSFDKLFGGKGKNKLSPKIDTKGINKQLKNLGGKKGTKVKLQADTKGLTKDLKNLGGKKGTKVKLQADTKGLTKGLKNLGGKKGVKVKLQADTKGLTKSLKNLGGKNGTKVKLQADTKSLTKSLSNLGKGKGVKVKLQADTKGLDKSLKSLKGLKKSQNIKINVSGNASSKISKIKSSLNGLSGKSKNISINARGNAVSQVNKIKSALNGIKGSKNISINASGNAASFASKVKSSLAGIHNKHVNISASGNAASMAQRASSAINSIPASHQTNLTAHDGVSSKANAARSAIESIPKKHNTNITVSGAESAIAKAHSVMAAINSIPSSKTVTINVNKNETHTITTEHKSKSMAITPENSQPVNPMTSMSVVAENPAMNMAVNSGAANMGVDTNSATNGDKVNGIATTDRSDSTQKVSEDYWRYMGNELYTGLPLDEKVQNLENAVTQADEDMDKLINLSKQRIDLDNKQIAYQRTMQGAYQQQITDVLNELHKYGFQTNGNQITNLNHAKDITGDNASKVDELLGKYQTAYQNFSEATKKIDELQTDIWQQGKNQQDYNNTKDQKMVEKLQRELELVTTAIDNQKNILEREGNSLEDSDYRMKLKNNSDQIYAKSEAVQQLLAEFNQLSVANFVGTKDADNAKNLADSLSQIRDAIMENLDSIDELKKSIRDIQLNSIIESLSKYTDNLSNSIDRLKNNVTNLQDGLLSGTSYNDLMSSNFDVVNLNQKSAYEKSVADKISLERQLDSALDQFARKNVDRTAQVANDQLQIEAQKYNDMLSMAINYARGARNEVGAIDVKYNVSVESDKIEVPNLTHNQEYVQSSIAYQKEMNELRAEYNRLMGEANTAEQKEAINSEMIYKQLGLQEKVYKSMIEADQKAINDLREQAKNPDMTTEQLKTITDQITEYEKNVIDAQNSIKDAVKNRFEYEKSLIDKQIDEYKRASDTISTLVSIADTLHLEGSTQAAIINQQYASTYREYNNYLDLLQRLRNELSGYEKNSYEYNQLKAMIDEYQTSLDSTMSSLMDISKNEFGQTLDSIQKEFEKSVNKGMTADQAKFDQDVWYNPMQKELRLEEMRLKIVELEDKTVEKRIAALDAQERMSKAEADYVDKQLDLALAQQKLDNTINKKDVRYLEKDKDGKFNWTYIADQANVEEAQRAVNSAKQALEESKISNRNDYIQKVSETINSIKDGSINQEEARKRLEQLNDSYKFILKDIPTFDIAKVEDIIKAYNDYEKKNSDILNDYKRSVKPEVTQGYETIVKGFGDQFKAVSKDLGEIFGKQLREALNLPNGIRNAYGDGNDKSVHIDTINLELPNVKDANDFAEALKTLPQVAKQYATKKM
ncbi:phage tail tape measure protein [Limosilactobacillus caviae]|uniref:phage tail tape measure protein n=1 Tax=Limosilactobacillus caviae TaxID=1769424 RepID=UPI001E653F76|nr:phage tail tape measure protein [Limosilactobacillus caviae]MCD7123254.1 phage tail tape measure protein [Limosilactobacillus caviae]